MSIFAYIKQGREKTALAEACGQHVGLSTIAFLTQSLTRYSLQGQIITQTTRKAIKIR